MATDKLGDSVCNCFRPNLAPRNAGPSMASYTRFLTFLELLFTTALIATVLSMALPVFSDAIDAQRSASAARYVAGRVFLARMEAVKRSTSVGLRFEEEGSDIRTGVDRLLMDKERLAHNFPGVHFGLMPGVPDVDGAPDKANGDGIRIGSARILTLRANGTATAGTLYVHGRQRQFAVRVFGVTGRTRVMRYDAKTRKWNE